MYLCGRAGNNTKWLMLQLIVQSYFNVLWAEANTTYINLPKYILLHIYYPHHRRGWIPHCHINIISPKRVSPLIWHIPNAFSEECYNFMTLWWKGSDELEVSTVVKLLIRLIKSGRLKSHVHWFWPDLQVVFMNSYHRNLVLRSIIWSWRICILIFFVYSFDHRYCSFLCAHSPELPTYPLFH